MDSTNNLCMNCMKEMPFGNTNCPNCNYNNNSPQQAPFLKKETLLFNRYIVGKVQSFKADSVTYIGFDTEENKAVEIVEFFPQNLVYRSDDESDVIIKSDYETVYKDYIQSFITLWTTLKDTVNMPCLPQVIDIIDSNCTVYAVCEFKDCISLKTYFEEKRTPLTWKRTHFAFKGIITALMKLHEAGIVHGNISPESVFVGSDGKIHLGKFSIKECFVTGSEMRILPTPGFSPIEAYTSPAAFDTHSDVYSLMALLYYCITGIIPSEAPKRMQKDDMVMPSAIAKTLSRSEIDTFVKGLSLRPTSRISDAGKLFNALYTSSVQSTVTSQSEAKRKPTTKQGAKQTAKKPATKKEQSNDNDTSDIVPLMIKTFATVIVACTLLFTTLYGTFLYKNYNIEFLNKILSPFSFLPINKVEDVIIDEPYEDEGTEITSQVQTSAYERSYVTVPDFTILTYESINANETYNNNFTIVYKYEYNSQFKKGAVIGQSLPVGESVLSGTEITIRISEGIEKVELPDVIGMTYKEAAKELKDKGFKVSKEVSENDGSETEDTVYMMNKVAGLEFDIGTEIILYIWDKVPETTTEESTTEETTKKKKPEKNKTTTNKAETTTKKSDND